ncbi:MAG: hypothetical protein IJI06_06025 [Oscillospiraceae bacterium]|nr:hypothetical protein [Oscillospiraceae bacterium]MBR3185156.1 hypothetical protein [Oscillospiraceae bacterium]
MRQKTRGNWIRFSLFMVFYAIIVLVVASIGLKLLWDFCENYEESLPTHKMDDYIASLSETKIKKIAFDFVATLDHNIQSEEDSYSEIVKCFYEGIHYKRVSGESSADQVRYAVFKEDQKLGEITLVRNPAEKGEKTWSVAEEDYDFSFLIHSQRFIVPEYWVVMCGNKRLGVQYIIDPMIEYPFLKEFYGKSFPMPHLAEYEISNYVGDPKIRFFDADGVEQPTIVFTDGRDQLQRSTGATYKKIESFTNSFVPLYINCLANTTRAATMNYYQILPYIVPDSEIDLRLKGAIAGQVFAQSNLTVINNICIHDIFYLGMTYYIVDLSFDVDTYSEKGLSDSETNMYLVVEVDEEVVKAVMGVLY